MAVLTEFKASPLLTKYLPYRFPHPSLQFLAHPCTAHAEYLASTVESVVPPTINLRHVQKPKLARFVKSAKVLLILTGSI